MDAYDEEPKTRPGVDGPPGDSAGDGAADLGAGPDGAVSDAPASDRAAADHAERDTAVRGDAEAETAVRGDAEAETAVRGDAEADTAVRGDLGPGDLMVPTVPGNLTAPGDASAPCDPGGPVPVPGGPAPGQPRGATAGIAALPLRSQVAAAFALAVVAVVTLVHLGMVFLHVAPSNTMTKQHGRAIDDWIYPEFEQNWKLFAPNPLQQNISVQVRALVRTPDGTSRETGWYDLSALDGEAIEGNLLPSHTQQNELRRAWDYYAATHDSKNRPVGLRGDLSERYLRRIAVMRLAREHAGGADAVVERIQVRSSSTNVPAPEWSEEKVSDKPVVRELPWWIVPDSDREGGLTEASAR
ncbi:DUF5819 family protein [Streptomyces sp. NPDC005813]|uniref:DUF5819 family protein n=1 Tax=Streptomyces sp. NPDC005813 TaxID=3155592 RepID=UPI0033E0F85A